MALSDRCECRGVHLRKVLLWGVVAPRCAGSLPGQGKGQVLALAVPEGGYWSAGRDVLGGPVLTPHPPPPSRTCEEPASNPPHVWPDDITKWPVRARWHRELGGTVVAASMGGNKSGPGAAGGSLGPDPELGFSPSCL